MSVSDDLFMRTMVTSADLDARERRCESCGELQPADPRIAAHMRGCPVARALAQQGAETLTAACEHGTEGARDDAALCSVCVGLRNAESNRTIRERTADDPLGVDGRPATWIDDAPGAGDVEQAIREVFAQGVRDGHIDPKGIAAAVKAATIAEVERFRQSRIVDVHVELSDAARRELSAGFTAELVPYHDPCPVECMHDSALDLLEASLLWEPDRDTAKSEAAIDVSDNIATVTFTLRARLVPR